MTDSTHHYYEPSQGHGLPHDPLNAIIGPRPIGWIASRGGDGTLNLAPYSFFNAFNYRPPIIGFRVPARRIACATCRRPASSCGTLRRAISPSG